MVALLPGIEPRTEENKIEFTNRSWNNSRVIDIQINYSATANLIKTDKEIFNHWLKLEAVNSDDLGQINDMGLTAYPAKPGQLIDEMFTGYSNKKQIVIKCDKYGENRKPPFNPKCERLNFLIADGMYVHYSYPRSYLRSWREIDDKVNQCINNLIRDKNHD